MEFKHLQNMNDQEATLLLYGELGSKVDGDFLANEITWLLNSGLKVNLRINSNGGSVIQGLSILNAILNKNVDTYIDGIAASMAGVIAVCGKRVFMNDFARIMVHNPSLANKKSASDKEKNALSHIGDMLASILSRRGCEKAKINNWMVAETWFTASDAVANNLADEIVNTGMTEKVNESIYEFVNENYKPKIEVMIEKVIPALGFDNDSGQDKMVEKIDSLKNQVTDLTGQISAADQKALEATDLVTAKETEIATLKDQLKAAEKSIVTGIVDKAISDNKIKKESREDLISLGCENKASLDKMLNAMKPATTKLTDLINMSGNGNPDKKDYDWYQKNDPQALLKMKDESPEQFTELFNAYLSN
jgi:ATP-dependent protease ClpP protease subunit